MLRSQLRTAVFRETSAPRTAVGDETLGRRYFGGDSCCDDQEHPRRATSLPPKGGTIWVVHIGDVLQHSSTMLVRVRVVALDYPLAEARMERLLLMLGWGGVLRLRILLSGVGLIPRMCCCEALAACDFVA